jgi:acetyl esterase/lipase
MKSITSFILLFLCCWFNLGAQDNPVTEEQKTYKTIGGTDLKTDLFYCENNHNNALKPAIVFFHGGGWTTGSPGEFHNACRSYARKGFVTISIQYRLSRTDSGTVPHPEITPVESVKDARSAMRWVRENASLFGIDPDKIIAAGQSAGGQLALSTAMFDDINESTDNLDISPVPVALLLFASNVNTMEAWVDWLLGDRREEIWSISPYHNLISGLPPAIHFHGSTDCMVDFYIVRLYHQKTLELGNYHELVTCEGKGHYLAEGNDKYATYFDEKVLERVDEFLIKFGFR